MTRPAVMLLFLLAACGTPQERCERRVINRIESLDTAIRATEAAVASGFRSETRSRSVVRYRRCTSKPSGFCSYVTSESYSVRVPVDIPAEKQRLQRERAERIALGDQLPADLAACQAPDRE